jgi:hypothetical protein
MASTWQSRRAWAKYLRTKNAPGVFNFDPDAFLIALERVFERQDDMLCDRARVLARSDRGTLPGSSEFNPRGRSAEETA